MRNWILCLCFALCFLYSAPVLLGHTGLGIDVDFYTGPISHKVWQQLKKANQKFVIAQAWGGRSLNAIEIDPARYVAYQNLGDLYYEMNRLEDARPYYEKYVQLVPNNPYTPTVRSRLGK